MSYLTKSCGLQVKDIDEKGRTVVVYASAFNNKDLDGDIIIPGAFKKTIAERGPKGSKEIRHLKQHNRNEIIGRPIELEEDATGLKAISYLVNTTQGNDALELYKNDLFQHSIGFVTIKGESDMAQDAYIIREVKLYEFSSVTWGANPLTPTVGMKSLFDDDLLTELTGRKDRLESAIRKGNFTDEAFMALESELASIQKLYAQLLSLKTTEPVKTTQPDEPQADQVIKLFRASLNI